MDRVNSPSHYNYAEGENALEVIDIIEMFNLNFSRGNAIKYVLRAGHKDEQGLDAVVKEIEDLNKACWYLQREIKNLKNLISIPKKEQRGDLNEVK